MEFLEPRILLSGEGLAAAALSGACPSPLQNPLSPESTAAVVIGHDVSTFSNAETNSDHSTTAAPDLFQGVQAETLIAPPSGETTLAKPTETSDGNHAEGGLVSTAQPALQEHAVELNTSASANDIARSVANSDSI